MGKLYILLSSIKFSGNKEIELNKFIISLLLIKLSIIDLSIKNVIIIKIIIIKKAKNDNLNDIENISFDDKDVT